MEMCVVVVMVSPPPLTCVVRSSPEMIPSIKVKSIRSELYSEQFYSGWGGRVTMNGNPSSSFNIWNPPQQNPSFPWRFKKKIFHRAGTTPYTRTVFAWAYSALLAPYCERVASLMAILCSFSVS